MEYDLQVKEFKGHYYYWENLGKLYKGIKELEERSFKENYLMSQTNKAYRVKYIMNQYFET